MRHDMASTRRREQVSKRKQSPSCKFCGRKLTTRERRETSRRYYDEPFGYVALSEWGDKMSKTHRQLPCPGCGRLTLWEPK